MKRSGTALYFGGAILSLFVLVFVCFALCFGIRALVRLWGDFNASEADERQRRMQAASSRAVVVQHDEVG